jgi:hypothetical protein
MVVNYKDMKPMVKFNSCNWCGKVYRLKRGFLTGIVLNRKYCSKKCQVEAEGEMSMLYLKMQLKRKKTRPMTKMEEIESV